MKYLLLAAAVLALPGCQQAHANRVRREQAAAAAAAAPVTPAPAPAPASLAQDATARAGPEVQNDSNSRFIEAQSRCVQGPADQMNACLRALGPAPFAAAH